MYVLYIGMSRLEKTEINKWRNEIQSSERNTLLRDLLHEFRLRSVTTRHEELDNTAYDIFNYELKNLNYVANQKSSGRCWIFSALNIIRNAMMNKYDLPPSFELSQSYLMYYDKIERSNSFCEALYDMYISKNKTFKDLRDDNIIMNTTDDGGTWDMFVKLIEKYGIMPKTFFIDSNSAGKSADMNILIKNMKMKFTMKVFEEHAKNPLSRKDFDIYKTEYIKEMYRVLTMLLGLPKESFEWEYYNKDGVYKSKNKHTPLSFYNKIVKPCINPKQYMAIINDPRNEYGKIYTLDTKISVLDKGRSYTSTYFNVPMDVIKEASLRSIKDNRAVWVGCDVSKSIHYDKGVMDDKTIMDMDIIGVNLDMTKKNEIETTVAGPTHAMAITGVRYDDDKKNYIRWKIENSWGAEDDLNGYLSVTDSWFDRYVFITAVDIKYLPKKYLDILMDELEHKRFTEFDPRDPFGVLAQYIDIKEIREKNNIDIDKGGSKKKNYKKNDKKKPPPPFVKPPKNRPDLYYKNKK